LFLVPVFHHGNRDFFIFAPTYFYKMEETVRTIYVGDLRTEATHVRSQNHLITDAPPDNKGKGEAFSPTDLLAAALGSCMITIMGIAAREHGFNMDGTQAQIWKIMASDPRRVGEVRIELTFPPVSYSDKEKKIIERSAYTCPVYLSLHPDLNKTIIFKFHD
jgi:putative redox protein